MTISSTTPRIQYVASGGQTVFTVPFKFFASSDLKVYLTPSGSDPDDSGQLKTLTTDYTVTGAGSNGGGTITLTSGATAGDIVTIVRDVPEERTTNLVPGGDLFANTLNDSLERFIAMVQEVNARVDRSLLLPESVNDAVSGDLPTPVGDRYLKWNSAGTGLVTVEGDAGAGDSAAVTFVQAGTGAVSRSVQDKLREFISVADFGALGDGVTDDAASFQAAVDALPANGGHIVVGVGDYAALTVGDVDIGNKAVTWIAEQASNLPDDLPGIVRTAGLFSLPESSIQANRTVRVHDRRKIDQSDATASARQYAHHVDGTLAEDGTTDERELRAFSFDLGTDVEHVNADIRGVKGRVYANGGSGNLRALYGFAEAVPGSGFVGKLTAVIGTLYKNGNAASESIAFRAHLDDGCTGGFEVAGAGINPAHTCSFGYRCRTGSGQPVLPTVACYQAHGGGAGDMFMGYKSHLDVDIANAPFRVKNSGIVKGLGFYSVEVSLDDDAVAVIEPPASSGMLKVWAQNAALSFGECYFRANGSPLVNEAYSASLLDFTTGALSGTTGVDGHITVSALDGAIHVENRAGGARSIILQFGAYG